MKGYIAGISFGFFAIASLVTIAISIKTGGAILLFLILSIVSGLLGYSFYRAYKRDENEGFVNVKKIAIISVFVLVFTFILVKFIFGFSSFISSDAQSPKLSTQYSDGGKAGASWEDQALDTAKYYLSYLSFSESGLIEQLEYEGFTHTQAKYAAEHCGADWNEQAVKKAKSYLNTMSFSRSELISQLEYEGFTHSQAVYGADHAIK